MTTIAPPKEKRKRRTEDETQEFTQLIPRYHVVLLDDNDHTYEYVIEMLARLFRHSRETAYQMAREVDHRGRCIVYTTSKEQAELKRSQIQSYGPDLRLPRSKGSMSAIIEPAD
jgi:ATP-dependent Clp protease adaptor protein ClpS